MDIMLENRGDKATLVLFKKLMALIFAYGSKNAIALVSNMQEITCPFTKNSDSVDKNDLIAYYILLICQVKYDLTEIEINPEYWYRMRLSDYSKMKPSLDKATNKIVEKFGLASFLKIVV